MDGKVAVLGTGPGSGGSSSGQQGAPAGRAGGGREEAVCAHD
jgi:hypothetical protein